LQFFVHSLYLVVWHVAVRCSMLQCIAYSGAASLLRNDGDDNRSVLQCVALCCTVLCCGVE